MVLEQFIPKGTRSAILTQIERITQPVTDFIRGNPIVSTAAIGIGTTGLVTGIARVVRGRRKKKKVKRRKVRRRKVTRKRVKVRHGRRVHIHKRRHIHRVKHRAHRRPRHPGHKRVSFTTATGKRVSFLVKPKSKRRSR